MSSARAGPARAAAASPPDRRAGDFDVLDSSPPPRGDRRGRASARPGAEGARAGRGAVPGQGKEQIEKAEQQCKPEEWSEDCATPPPSVSSGSRGSGASDGPADSVGSSAGKPGSKAAVDAFLKEHRFAGVNHPKVSCLKSTYPLHRAATKADAKMVDMLVREGADPTLRDSRGLLAAQAARERNNKDSHTAVLRVLSRHADTQRAAAAGA